LADEAASYVRDLITSGKLVAGDPVRPEVIAQELEISSTPAREALQTLRSEGFLELSPRKGFRVTQITGDDIRDLFLLNSMVAGELAARAARGASEGTIARIRSIQRELITAALRRDATQLELMNHRFHREINLAAGSRRLAGVIQLVSRWVPKHFYASIEGWSATTVHDHEELLDAFERHDAEGARRLMADHMLRAGEQLAEFVDQRGREQSHGEQDRATFAPAAVEPSASADTR
jgi:DNA-binding GntR family transcriptional regulator